MEISLIYPSNEHYLKHIEGIDNPNISNEVLDELGLNSIIDLRSSRLCDFFTMDKDVIEYRQEVFGDMISNPELSNVLIKLNPILSDIAELRRLSNDADDSDSYLYSITEIELYMSCLELLSNELSPLKPKLSSKAFIGLVDKVK